MNWTAEALRTVKMRCVGHADGSQTAMWIYEADEPSISKLVTLHRRTKTTTTVWLGGGRECRSLEELADALNQGELAL